MKQGSTTPLPIWPGVIFKRKTSQDFILNHLAGFVSMHTGAGMDEANGVIALRVSPLGAPISSYP